MKASDRGYCCMAVKASDRGMGSGKRGVLGPNKLKVGGACKQGLGGRGMVGVSKGSGGRGANGWMVGTLRGASPGC